MTYEELLENAPDHQSEEFLVYLMNNNKVVMDNLDWLVIENFKYHTEDLPHYTAFFKDQEVYLSGDNILELSGHFPDFDLLIKAASKRSVNRFHVHLIK